MNLQDFVPEEKWLHDGIYEILENAVVLKYNDAAYRIELTAEIQAVLNANPNYVVVNAYQTDTTFIITEPVKLLVESPWGQRQPESTEFKCSGSWFNYGSCNLLENCPKRLLILAEDD